MAERAERRSWCGGRGLENASTVVAEDNDDVVEPTIEDNEPRDAVGLLLTEELPLATRGIEQMRALKFCEGLATGKARKRWSKLSLLPEDDPRSTPPVLTDRSRRLASVFRSERVTMSRLSAGIYVFLQRKKTT